MLVLLLALVLCICVFASCGDGKEPSGTGDSGVATESGSEAEEKLGVPETADYGGETFNILTAGNVAYEDFKFVEESSLQLDNAQYKRKALVE